MSRLFLDTGIFVAAVSATDEHHAAARSVLRRISAREWESVYTSDFVVAEALNYVARKIRRREAADLVLALAFGADDAPAFVSSVVRIHGGRFAAAVELLRSKFARGLSLTDWTSVVAMEEMRIGHIATFDGGFKGLATVVDG